MGVFFLKIPESPPACPQGLFFPQKSRFRHQRARRGFFFVKKTRFRHQRPRRGFFSSKSPVSPPAFPQGLFFFLKKSGFATSVPAGAFFSLKNTHLPLRQRPRGNFFLSVTFFCNYARRMTLKSRRHIRHRAGQAREPRLRCVPLGTFSFLY